MNNIFGICHLAVVPVRLSASDKSEMVSQLIFGDVFSILEQEERWLKVKSLYDDYEGWIDVKQYQKIAENDAKQLNLQPQFLTRDASTIAVKLPIRENLYLPIGSVLPQFENQKCVIANTTYQLLGNHNVMPDKEDFNADLEEIAFSFLGVPYLWGGKTHFGIDCSGYTQTVFKLLGIKLKRDAWQQAEQGKLVDFIQHARSGDLAFFDNEEGKITHVGIMINNNRIVHASGKVKIENIDYQGIFSTELNKYTHKLRIIKRFI